MQSLYRPHEREQLAPRGESGCRHAPRVILHQSMPLGVAVPTRPRKLPRTGGDLLSRQSPVNGPCVVRVGWTYSPDSTRTRSSVPARRVAEMMSRTINPPVVTQQI
jgi:hypothetical protein